MLAACTLLTTWGVPMHCGLVYKTEVTFESKLESALMQKA